MKREDVNTIIAVLALVISGVSVWFQVRPVNDELTFIEARPDNLWPLKESKFSLIEAGRGDQTSRVISPVKWNVLLVNPLDRPVSIIGARLFTQDEHGLEWSSSMLKQVAFASKDTWSSVPFDVPAYSSQRLFIESELPISPEAELECPVENSLTLGELENCYFRQGFDLFGNEVVATFFSEKGRLVEWKDQSRSPRLVLELSTGDGSKLNIPIEFYPDFSGRN